jgi:GT2 family glycosyltransferase
MVDVEGLLLSIIIPARSNPADTANCLTSVLYSLATLQLNCELVLIDDASEREQGLLEVFLKHRPGARQHRFVIARSNKHQHYTGVFSIGLHLATGDNVIFISNDMLVTPFFLTALFGVSALRAEFGIVRGTSNYVDSHPEHMVSVPPGAKAYKDLETFSRAQFDREGLAFTEDNKLSGDAVLIKRRVIERIGVMDLRFFGYFGDVDFGMRAHGAGFKLVCAKGAWLFHKGAGHINDDVRGGPAARTERTALVESAYQAFREKWDHTLPGRYTGLATLDFAGLVRTHAHRVELKYDFSPAVLDDLEFH